MVAGLFALDLDHDERVARMERGLVGTRGLFRPTLPLVSLTSSKRIVRMLRDPAYLGDGHMEDTWLPWYCVSTNLSRGHSVVHERGPAWLAIRASVALPGVLPPVHSDGDLLVDGGRAQQPPGRRHAGRGSTAASWPSTSSPPSTSATRTPFDPTLSGWRVLGGKLNPFRPASARAEPRADRAPGQAGRRRPRAAGRAGRRTTSTSTSGHPIESFGALNFKAGRGLVDAAYRFTVDQLAAGAGDVLR